MTITTINWVQNIGAAIAGAVGVRKADDGLVTGPEGPCDDAIPAWLSNGEFVVNSASTSRHRPLLEAINAQQLAGGGEVRHPIRPPVSEMRPVPMPWHNERTSAPQRIRIELGAITISGKLDTRTGIAQLTGAFEKRAQQIADQRIDNWERSEKARAGL